VARVCGHTSTSIGTGSSGTEVDPGLAVLAHPSRLAVALIVVQQLHTVRCALPGAGVGQTLVDVTLAPWTCVARATLTLESSNPVNANSTVEAGSIVAFVQILFTQFALGARRTGTGIVSDKIVAGSTIPTRVGVTIVDVVLTLSPHEAAGTATAVGRQEVVAGGPIVTGVG